MRCTNEAHRRATLVVMYVAFNITLCELRPLYQRCTICGRVLSVVCRPLETRDRSYVPIIILRNPQPGLLPTHNPQPGVGVSNRTTQPRPFGSTLVGRRPSRASHVRNNIVNSYQVMISVSHVRHVCKLRQTWALVKQLHSGAWIYHSKMLLNFK